LTINFVNSAPNYTQPTECVQDFIKTSGPGTTFPSISKYFIETLRVALTTAGNGWTAMPLQ